jgi:hypothetical protein
MSATSAEDESGTVREEGMYGEVAKGKQLMEKSEFSRLPVRREVDFKLST